MQTAGRGIGLFGSSILLPGAGGNVLLTIVAATALLVSSAVIASSIIRLVAKKALKA